LWDIDKIASIGTGPDAAAITVIGATDGRDNSDGLRFNNIEMTSIAGAVQLRQFPKIKRGERGRIER
jgi:hypothetical protein